MITDEQMIAELEEMLRDEGGIHLSTKHASRLLALAKAGMRLPKTEDHKPVAPGDFVYHPHTCHRYVVVDGYRAQYDLIMDGSQTDEDRRIGDADYIRIGLTVSTPAAAAAARAAEQENQ